MIIEKICKRIRKILKNKKLSNEVEDGIYNFSINYAENNNTTLLNLFK